MSVVQIVTAVERKGSKVLKVVETKRLTEKNINDVLENKIEIGSTLITDKHPSYTAFGKSTSEIIHKSVRASEHLNKQDRSVHLQTVNQTHAQLRKFLCMLNGPCSTPRIPLRI